MADSKPTFTRNQKVAAGIIGLCLAGGLFFWKVLPGLEGPGNTCKLTAASVGLLASGLARRESASQLILTTGGGVAVDAACESLINSLVDHPTTPTPLEIETNSGPVTKTVTAPQLTASPSTPPSTPSIQDPLFACLNWNANLLVQWCLDGSIGPPTQ
jgi:hypothetical protein